MPASLGGTLHPNEPEASIPGGGETLEITLSGAAFWVAGGTEFDAQRQGIIDGMTSNRSTDDEPTGWNAIILPGQTVGGVVRSSDRLIIITLDAFSTYDITRTETISVIIPDDAQNPEQEIHPGADAGPGVQDFSTMGACTQINSTQSPTPLTNTSTNIGVQDFSTMGSCIAATSTQSPAALSSTFTQNFTAMGTVTFVTSTS